MILGRALTESERRDSRKNYLCYCAVNGFSYMCLGETMLILFAVNLGCSDTIVAVLGSMLYFGFLLLPLGKITTARVGAVRTLSNFWIARNTVALMIAGAAPVSLLGFHNLAVCMLVAGAFLFYGFRAAGVVMSQPLLGEISDPGKQGSFISRSWVWFYGCGLLALLLITGSRKLSSSIWVLFGCIVAGTAFGFTSAAFFRRIHETGEIRDSAKKPMWEGIRQAVADSVVRRQVITGMICHLGVILTVPISMLALKRGYGVSDAEALMFSLVQFVASSVLSWLQSLVTDRLGGRRMTLVGFYGYYLIAFFWLFAPDSLCRSLTILPFLLCPCGTVILENSLQQYFIATVEKSKQVAASVVISVGTGAVAGLLGMLLSSILLKLSAGWNRTGLPLDTYRWYFGMVLILLPVMGIFVHWLKDDRSGK